MFICGNSPEAKRSVGEVLRQFGWEPFDCGGIVAARAIEPLCMLWCIPGFLRNEWTPLEAASLQQNNRSPPEGVVDLSGL
jgi:hypothetical protein